MGLGLAVISALLFLLPGIAFAFGLTKIHSRSKPSAAPFDQHFSPTVVLVVVAAAVAHGLVIAIWNSALGWSPQVDASQSLPLLAGDLKSPVGELAVRSVAEHPLRIGMYFLALTAAWGWLGKFLNQFIRDRNRATWYNLLRPGDDKADFVWLTVDLKLDDSCYLFAGIVREFDVATDGLLTRVVLSDAVRRPLHCDAKARIAPGTDDGWTEIPGEYLVLQMEHVRTLNVDYIFVEEEPPPRI